jgi:hypothetical protein
MPLSTCINEKIMDEKDFAPDRGAPRAASGAAAHFRAGSGQGANLDRQVQIFAEADIRIAR